jgi:hypothetical protein
MVFQDEKTQDWRRVDVTFNSLDFSEVNLYPGVWGGTTGTIWWDDLRMDYYHTAMIHWGQVMCCMAETKVYDILKWQIEQVHKNLAPDGYFMQHDEIRVQGWDASCAKTGLTPGALLADNVKKCTGIIQREDPGKPIYVWSDDKGILHGKATRGTPQPAPVVPNTQGG